MSINWKYKLDEEYLSKLYNLLMTAEGNYTQNIFEYKIR